MRKIIDVERIVTIRVDELACRHGVEAVEHRAQRREQEHRHRDAEHRQRRPPLAAPGALQDQADEFHAVAHLFDERALLEMQQVRGALGGVRVVRHHDDRLLELLVQPLQQREDFRRRLRIEVAGRLVGDEQRRIGDDRAGDRDALLLAAGELPRIVLSPGRRARRCERGHDVLAALRLRELRQQQRQLDVLERRQHRDQVVELEDEPDVPRAPRGERALGQAADLGVADPDRCRASAGRCRRSD